jgi:hypothetical protein
VTATESRFRPLTEGEVIRVSRLRLLLLVLACAGGVVAFGAALAPPAKPDRHGRVGRAQPALGVVGVLVCACAAWQVVRPWRRDRRLLLGGDRLQLLEGDAVLGEVPYDNIAAVVVQHRRRSESQVLVRLRDACRPDTRWVDPPGFRAFLKATSGFDLVIDPGFRGGPEVIRAKILGRCQDLP